MAKFDIDKNEGLGAPPLEDKNDAPVTTNPDTASNPPTVQGDASDQQDDKSADVEELGNDASSSAPPTVAPTTKRVVRLNYPLGDYEAADYAVGDQPFARWAETNAIHPNGQPIASFVEIPVKPPTVNGAKKRKGK